MKETIQTIPKQFKMLQFDSHIDKQVFNGKTVLDLQGKFTLEILIYIATFKKTPLSEKNCDIKKILISYFSPLLDIFGKYKFDDYWKTASEDLREK